jgi:OOP family OmpA-OmpF porin
MRDPISIIGRHRLVPLLRRVLFPSQKQETRMTIKTLLRRSTPLVLAGLISTPATAGLIFNDVAEIRERAPAGDTFNAQLVQEYKKIALFEADEMYDWVDAENHATKGNMAAEGTTPLPYTPAEWDIESERELRELELARAELVTILDDGARSSAPHEAAVAQAKYDCWVEQQEEGHQPAHIAACRDAYLAALDDLKAAVAPEPVKTTAVVQDEIARETVYFEFDKSTITGQAQAKIDSFVAEMKQIQPVVTLYIAGHADTTGPNDYNYALSQDRAASVRTELERQGMTVGSYSDLEIEAQGETDLAVPTADGVREPRNRRVEIIAHGQVTKVIDQTAAVSQ